MSAGYENELPEGNWTVTQLMNDQSGYGEKAYRQISAWGECDSEPGTWPIGWLQYVVKQDEDVFSDDEDIADNAKGDFNGYYSQIVSLRVHPNARRQGVASAMWEEFKKVHLNDPARWDTGDFTADGAAFYQSVEGEEVGSGSYMEDRWATVAHCTPRHITSPEMVDTWGQTPDGAPMPLYRAISLELATTDRWGGIAIDFHDLNEIYNAVVEGNTEFLADRLLELANQPGVTFGKYERDGLGRHWSTTFGNWIHPVQYTEYESGEAQFNLPVVFEAVINDPNPFVKSEELAALDMLKGESQPPLRKGANLDLRAVGVPILTNPQVAHDGGENVRPPRVWSWIASSRNDMDIVMVPRRMQVTASGPSAIKSFFASREAVNRYHPDTYRAQQAALAESKEQELADMLQKQREAEQAWDALFATEKGSTEQIRARQVHEDAAKAAPRRWEIRDIQEQIAKIRSRSEMTDEELQRELGDGWTTQKAYEGPDQCDRCGGTGSYGGIIMDGTCFGCGGSGRKS